MSWISAIKTGYAWLTGKSLAAAVTRTVLLGYAVRKLNDSAKKDNPTGSGADQPDPGARIQIEASTQNKVPVVYGEAFVAGAITEAVMSADRKTMTYVITICEHTGTKLSDDLASTYAVEDIYWNDQRLIFYSNGRDVNYSTDRDGNIDASLKDQVTIRVYAGGSAAANYVTPDNYGPFAGPNAWEVVPNWTTDHTMDDLVFAVVSVTYNREKGVNGLGNLVFHIRNSMEQPGDCIYDYMTNTRYGAGIPPEEIYSE